MYGFTTKIKSTLVKGIKKYTLSNKVKLKNELKSYFPF